MTSSPYPFPVHTINQFASTGEQVETLTVFYCLHFPSIPSHPNAIPFYFDFSFHNREGWRLVLSKLMTCTTSLPLQPLPPSSSSIQLRQQRWPLPETAGKTKILQSHTSPITRRLDPVHVATVRRQCAGAAAGVASKSTAETACQCHPSARWSLRSPLRWW